MMPPPAARIWSVNQSGDVTLPIGVETVICSLAIGSLPDANATVKLSGYAKVTTGVGATTFTPRIRRTSLTGALVGEQDPYTSPASNTLPFQFAEDDQPGDVASLIYVLTGVCAGVGGTAIHAYIQAIIED